MGSLIRTVHGYLEFQKVEVLATSRGFTGLPP